MSLLDKILNPDKYEKIQLERNKIEQEKREYEEKKREENYEKSIPYWKKAVGKIEEKSIILTLEWLQPYSNHGWWILTFKKGYSKQEEWYGYECYSSNFKWAGYKSAKKEFNRIVKQFELQELKEYEL